MAILGISISALNMPPGEIFLPQLSDQSNLGPSQSFTDLNWFIVVIQGFQIILLILLPIYIVLGLLSKRGRRNLWLEILKILIPFLLVMWISEAARGLMRPEEGMELQPGYLDLTGIPRGADTFPSFEANPQPLMLTLIIIGAAALVAVITFYGLKSLSKPKPVDDPQFLEFADKAQTALDDIEAAEIDFDDVIIRCYAEMSMTLQAEKGIRRARAMTTHEFEQVLLAKGFPSRPVQQLTQLFEQVRYGRQQLGEDAKLVATESLRKIIDFCKRQT